MSIKIPFIESEITDQYLYDDNPRPWVIGFSGGKDSTLLLQLIWNALKKVPEQMRTREIYVVCNDTLVENPRIVKFIESTLKKIELSAVEQSLPIRVQRTTPRLEDTFWVNLIGKGYPAPNNSFRWCTERLKINPTTQFIKSKIDERGEVIILLGTRTDESSTRSRSMKKHALKGQRLRKHMLPNAFVYALISDIETGELWQYMMQVSPPWGGTHKELVTLYKNANSGDCPLVIDESTPSCGNSRFGCWVCTVVKRDKSMEGLIVNGEEWMLPLVEFRDYLMESRDIRENREKRRRFEAKNVEDEDTWGPYVEDVRATMLKKLLAAQHEIQQEQGETLQLISHQELIAIQVIWYREGLFRNSVADIYNSIFNTHIDMSKRVLKMREEEQLLREICSDSPDQFELIQNAVKLVKSKSIMIKKRGMQNDIEKLLEDYLDRKELMNNRQAVA